MAASPIPDRLREPLSGMLRGTVAGWPDPLSANEVEILVAHGVAPLVFAATAASELRAGAIAASARETIYGPEVADVLESLHRRGVDALLMKGTALAYEVYARPDLRPRGDTDLLIAPDAVAAARATLLECGFALTPSIDDYWVRQMMFRRPGSGTFDVHWSVTSLPFFEELFRFDELRGRSVALPALSPHARAFSRIDALLLACVHRLAHHQGSDRLIWLADIALLRSAMTAGEQKAFWRRAAEGRVVGLCENSFEAAEAWWGRDEGWSRPDPRLLAQNEPSRVLLDRDIRFGRMILANLGALPWREQLQRLLQLAFPPPRYIRATIGKGRKAPVVLLYALRAVRGVVRLFRRCRTL